jgi:hypothetical protein
MLAVRQFVAMPGKPAGSTVRGLTATSVPQAEVATATTDWIVLLPRRNGSRHSRRVNAPSHCNHEPIVATFDEGVGESTTTPLSSQWSRRVARLDDAVSVNREPFLKLDIGNFLI